MAGLILTGFIAVGYKDRRQRNPDSSVEEMFEDIINDIQYDLEVLSNKLTLKYGSILEFDINVISANGVRLMRDT